MGEIRVVARGMRFPEGPSIDHFGRLYVVELGAGRVSRIGEDGARETFAEMAGAPNGSAFAADGTLWIANNGGLHSTAESTDDKPGPGGAPALIQRVDPSGAVTTVIDRTEDGPLNAPNDLCFDRDGNLWFTDPVWPAVIGDEVAPGPIACLTPYGRAVHVDTPLRFPNGIAFLPNADAFVVAESYTGDLWRFEVDGPGRVSPPTLYATCGAGSLPDGFAFDADGRLLVAGHGTNSVHVFRPDGTEEDRVFLGSSAMPSNVAFGGVGGRTAYVTAANSGEVLAFEWPTPGLVLHGSPRR